MAGVGLVTVSERKSAMPSLNAIPKG
jgi:hypothetical protein